MVHQTLESKDRKDERKLNRTVQPSQISDQSMTFGRVTYLSFTVYIERKN